MRKKVIAGNWKMYTTPSEGVTLTEELLKLVATSDMSQKEVIIIPPFTHLGLIAKLLEGNKNISLGAQNCWYENEGAFTGEIAPAMLKDLGCDYVIIGHSERRAYFGEDNALLAKKVKAVIAQGMIPIYCCGESLEQREQNLHFDITTRQISEGLFELSQEEFSRVVIAYEPVWAIGTGKTASPEQAQEIHHAIRNSVSKQYGKSMADQLIILYGGSVKPNNAQELFSQEDIDGGLVGGASLKAADFAGIINA